MLELIRKIVFLVTGKNDINYDTDFVQDHEYCQRL